MLKLFIFKDAEYFLLNVWCYNFSRTLLRKFISFSFNICFLKYFTYIVDLKSCDGFQQKYLVRVKKYNFYIYSVIEFQYDLGDFLQYLLQLCKNILKISCWYNLSRPYFLIWSPNNFQIVEIEDR